MTEQADTTTMAMFVNAGDRVQVDGRTGTVGAAGEAKGTVCAMGEWDDGEDFEFFWDSFERVEVL